MNSKKRFLCFCLSLLVYFIPATVQGQPDVLKPENENEARLNRLQPPDAVMDIIGVKPNMVVAEIGAGRGRYVVQLAVRVGQNGKVFAEDIDDNALVYLKERCRRGGLKNVEAILGEVMDPRLPAGQVDLIWIVSSYHHFADPISLLRHARSALKPGGRLAIGEWSSADEIKQHGTSPHKIAEQMRAAGFTLERVDTSFQANDFLIHLFRITESR